MDDVYSSLEYALIIRICDSNVTKWRELRLLQKMSKFTNFKSSKMKQSCFKLDANLFGTSKTWKFVMNLYDLK